MKNIISTKNGLIEEDTRTQSLNNVINIISEYTNKLHILGFELFEIEIIENLYIQFESNYYFIGLANSTIVNYDRHTNAINTMIHNPIENYNNISIAGCNIRNKIIFNIDYIELNLELYLNVVVPHEISHYLHNSILPENIDMILCNTEDYKLYSENGYYDSNHHGVTFKLIEKYLKEYIKNK